MATPIPATVRTRAKYRVAVWTRESSVHRERYQLLTEVDGSLHDPLVDIFRHDVWVESLVVVDFDGER